METKSFIADQILIIYRPQKVRMIDLKVGDIFEDDSKWWVVINVEGSTVDIQELKREVPF